MIKRLKNKLRSARLLYSFLILGEFAERILNLLEQDSDEDQSKKFAALYKKLTKVSPIFNMDDDDFFDSFEIDRNSVIIPKNYPENFFADLFDEYFRLADAMAANLHYGISFVLWKAMKKLMLITDIPLDKSVDAALQASNYYGTTQRTTETLECFDFALKMAQDEANELLAYVVLMRKFSWCMANSQLNQYIQVDDVRRDVMQALINLCDEKNTTPRGVGTLLVKKAEDEMKSADSQQQKVIKERIAKVKEAMVIMDMLLSCARGDAATVANVEKELSDYSTELYGTEMPDTVEQIKEFYLMLFQSNDRSEVEEPSKIEWDEANDNDFLPEKPEGMLYSNWFPIVNKCANNEMLSGHKNAAELLLFYLYQLAVSLCSDYHQAMQHYMIGRNADAFGDYDKAKSYYELALSVLGWSSDTDSDVNLSPHLYYMVPFSLALLTKKKETAKAIELITDAIDNIEEKERLALLTTLFILHRADIYLISGDRENAEKDIIEALSMLRDEIAKRLPLMDAEVKERMWTTISGQIELAARLIDDQSSAMVRKAVYDAVLYAKGFLLSSENSVKKAVAEEGMEEAKRLYDEVEAMRRSLAPWGTSTDGDAEKYVKLFMAETKLTYAISERVVKYYDFMNIEYDAIRNALDEKSVVMDCFDYDDEGDRKYLAFVYGKEDAAPRIVRFDVDDIYNQVRFEEYDKVWFVPSGALHKIPVESVTRGGIRRLSHARNIMMACDDNFDSIALFGDLKYGGEDGNSDDSTDLRGFIKEMNAREIIPLRPWPSLANTGREVNAIEFVWKMCVNKRVNVYKGIDGSAERFVSLNGESVSIIHLATHGFFVTKETSGELPVLQGTVRPMDMAGVVMSNGNRGWLYGDRMKHEGILLASDIAKMDLSGTELVVLSSCHSGNGTVRADGVYGMQRALKKAGVKTLVMSLSDEEDEVGYAFMKEFYSRMIGNKMERHEAFEQAREAMRKAKVDEKLWTGFIMID